MNINKVEVTMVNEKVLPYNLINDYIKFKLSLLYNGRLSYAQNQTLYIWGNCGPGETDVELGYINSSVIRANFIYNPELEDYIITAGTCNDINDLINNNRFGFDIFDGGCFSGIFVTDRTSEDFIILDRGTC